MASFCDFSKRGYDKANGDCIGTTAHRPFKLKRLIHLTNHALDDIFLHPVELFELFKKLLLAALGFCLSILTNIKEQ